MRLGLLRSILNSQIYNHTSSQIVQLRLERCTIDQINKIIKKKIYGNWRQLSKNTDDRAHLMGIIATTDVDREPEKTQANQHLETRQPTGHPAERNLM